MTSQKRSPVSPGTLDTYPVLPLRDIVVFPHMIVPLFVGREKSIRALEEVMKADKFILLATQVNATDDDPATDAIFETGTLASVLQLLKLPDGTVKVLVEGSRRARVTNYVRTDEFYEADAEVLADEPIDKVEVEALARSVVSEFESYVKLNKKISPEVVAAVGQTSATMPSWRTPWRLTLPSRSARSRRSSRLSVRHQAAGEVPRPDGKRDLRPAGREAHPHAREAPDGEDAARVLPQRADEGDPEGTRRRGRQGRPGRARAAHQGHQAVTKEAREKCARRS